MNFELQLLLENVLIPGGIATAFAIVVWLLEARIPPSVASGLIGAGWWLAVLAGHTALVKWKTWPEPSDAWLRLLWVLLPMALVLGASSCCHEKRWRWLTAIIFVAIGSWLIMPSGDSWKDMLPFCPLWIAVIVPSVLCNATAVEKLYQSDASRWGNWVLIASLGAVVAIALGVYGTLAQWFLSALSATIGVSLLSSVRKTAWGSAVAFPTAMVLACGLAWTQFLSGSPKAWWLYGLILFMPTLVAGLDGFLEARWKSKGRVVLAAILSAIPVGIVIVEWIQS